jgi:hypothetical protein
MEEEPTQIKQPIFDQEKEDNTQTYIRTNYGRTIQPMYEVQAALDWRAATFIVALVILVEAFTLALVLVAWEVLT